MEVVKVCGLRKLEDIEYCAENGNGKITHLGIICVPGRKRSIEREVGLKISQVLDKCTTKDKRPKLVGVFRNQPLNDIIALTKEYRLDAVQFHDDNPEWLEWSLELLNIQKNNPLFEKAFSSSPSSPSSSSPSSSSSSPSSPSSSPSPSSSSRTNTYPPFSIIKRWCFPRDRMLIVQYAKKISEMNLQNHFIFLFDSETGGEGKVSNDWKAVSDFLQEIRKNKNISTGLKFVMAGGISPENVQILKKTCPEINGMDVSSGVENEKTGWKDYEKVERYVAEASMKDGEYRETEL